ncbi:MAG TPA: phosphoglycerate dehydrogenase [Vitreimonas sp.]|uniref:phosphoglycerate dehydrogenase n=1 Tax=Vitreimonas sp. TaxID=3069702 RepID=UPI002D257562|nr:phosphoglycerate dehydrogenase [Vitreimonas sp.]HYD89274.1 phosphoglycerate dehydrogenase [Vitreimonas sp.]
MTSKLRRVVVTQNFFDEASIAYLRAHDCDVVIARMPEGYTEATLDVPAIKSLIGDASGWIVGHARITREVLEALPELQIVSRRGVGYERVDTEAARDLGRVVTIAAGGNDATVADQVIGMMIAVGRRFREAHAQMQTGPWKILLGADLYRKTVGIIGLGRIGRSLVQRLQGFEANIQVSEVNPDPGYAAKTGVKFVDVETILRESDYISLHTPLTPQTRHIINAAAIEQMKPGAFVFNCARGGLVNDADLLAALKDGRLGGAGLDVFESESDPAMKPVTDELLALHNVVAAPHAGASTREGLDRTNMIASECVVAVLDGKAPPKACVVVDGRR